MSIIARTPSSSTAIVHIYKATDAPSMVLSSQWLRLARRAAARSGVHSPLMERKCVCSDAYLRVSSKSRLRIEQDETVSTVRVLQTPELYLVYLLIRHKPQGTALVARSVGSLRAGSLRCGPLRWPAP